ncbi:hypothetical protein [Pseudacidovorax intermedius]|uniref:hypothetical protein n=1 Tax=Pseudacidovorax intermedius TaxID=433924 RepID=UPI0026F010F3|nr:hypothetical protein [Pseudacidovorax intermedius]
MRRTVLTVTALAAAMLAAGCSSDERRFYEAYKCAKVATMMARPAEAAMATARIAVLVQTKDVSNISMARMAQRLDDDLALHRLSPSGQARALLDVYDSGTCTKLYAPS